MPLMSKTLENTGLVRMLCYGAPLTRKTWWALRAAEEGFNIIHCDIDGGHHIAANLSPEAQGRIYHLDMRAPVDSYDNSGVHVLAHAMHGNAAIFDETDRKYVPVSKLEQDRTYTKIDLTKLDEWDILVIDSWSALVAVLTESSNKVLNPTTVPKLEWDNYGSVRLVLDHFISGIKRLNCHVIVIGHSETFAKRKPDADPKGKPHETIDQIRLQPASISRNHGETLARNFTDTLFFDLPNSTVGVYIDTRGSSDFDAGSRRLAPKRYKWDDVSFSEFVPRESRPIGNASFTSKGIISGTGAELAPAKQSATISAGGSAGGTAAKPSPILNRLKS